MKIKYKHHLRKGFSLVELLVVIAIIAGLAAMSYGPIMKQVKAAAKTNAIGNGKNIYTALFSYAKENDGIYPNEDTAGNDESGDTPEGAFTQLINSGAVDNEEIFWSKENAVIGTVKTVKPDNDGTVTAGENAWGYVAGLTTSSRTNLPIVFDASASPGVFDTAVWEGSSIVAKLDGSVQALEISVSSGGPYDETGASKQGPVVEKRGKTEVNIFSEESLPGNAEVLTPTSEQ